MQMENEELLPEFHAHLLAVTTGVAPHESSGDLGADATILILSEGQKGCGYHWPGRMC